MSYIILKDKSIELAVSYVKDVIDDVRKKKIDIKLMVIRTQLRKEIKHKDNIQEWETTIRKMAD